MSEETKVKYEKPIPLKTIDNTPYWDAADRHELVLQKCNCCNAYNHPPGPSCTSCGSPDITWESQGNDIRGKVYTYVVSYRPFLPGFQNDIPLVIAVVELDNIPEVKIIGNVLNATAQDLAVGTAVKMVWVDVNDNRAIPQWELA
ncbi:Zn-ribbon domain-containing OB-fold protein [uncultured Rummeliibacillus sp.]|uniref:Zn-ribbon domain-containing OB-fold protein n=1 Tax=uncultured Rummeliibacillus sp. TaxID=762292 RepID=UPI002634A0F9|nr:OB-fold domain-containing protein [uncultured Rummeliibacillus sp.]